MNRSRWTIGLRRSRCWLAGMAGLLGLTLGLTGCWGGSSVGALFDRDGAGDGGGGGEDPGNLDPSSPVDGGLSIPGRPFVRRVAPTDGAGNAHPETPLVIYFNESVNRATLGSDTVFVRPVGGASLSASIRTLHGDRVAILSPDERLIGGTDYELVVTTGIGDLDGERLNAGDETVASTFTVAVSEPSLAVLDLIPFDGEQGVPSSTDLFVILNEPVDVASVSNQSVQVPSGPGGTVDLDDDGQLLTFSPSSNFPIGSTVNWTVRSGLRDTDLSGSILSSDVPASFVTLELEPIPDIAIISGPQGTDPLTGRAAAFISQANQVDYTLDVQLPGSTQAGDRVFLRFAEQAGTDRATFERTAIGSGVVRYTVDLSQAGLSDGIIVVAAWLQRGGTIGTFFVDSDLVIKDTLPPQLLELGPPVGSNAGAFLSPLQRVSVYGTASESLQSVTLALPSLGAEVGLFDQVLEPILSPPGVNSFFMTEPVDLGNRRDNVEFSLLLTDAAGNSTVPTTGTAIVPRGALGGSRVSITGQLTVIVYDSDSLRGISGATVIVHSAANPISQGVRRTTDSLGRLTIPAGDLPGSEPYLITAYRFSAEPMLDTSLTTIYSTSSSVVPVPVSLRLGSIGTVSGVVQNLGGASVTGGASANLGLTLGTAVIGFNALLPTFDIDVFPNGVLAVTGFGAATFPPTNGAAAFNDFTTQFPVRPSPPDGSSVVNLDFNVPAPAMLTTLGGPATTLTFDNTGLGVSTLEEGSPSAVVVARPLSSGGFEGVVPTGLGVLTLVEPPRPDVLPDVDDAGLVAVFQQFVPKNPDGTGDNEIFAIDLNTFATTRITNNTVNDSRPRISRDGLKVVWESGPAGLTEIRVANIDASNQVILVSNGVANSRPVISNDTGGGQRWVVYQTLVFGLDLDIARVEVDDLDNSIVTAPADLTGNTASDQRPAIDALAARIYYISDELAAGDDDLFVLTTSSMIKTPLAIAGTDEGDPTTSSDGAIFAVTSSGLGLGSGIAVAQFSQPFNFIPLSISPSLTTDTVPRLSGDGGTVAFERVFGTAKEVMIATDFNYGAQTATLRRMTQNAQRDQEPVLVGDGSQVLYSSNLDDDFEIYLAATANPLPIPFQLTDQAARYSYQATYALDDPNHIDGQTQLPRLFENAEVELFAEGASGELAIARRLVDALPSDVVFQRTPQVLAPTPGQSTVLTGANVAWTDDIPGDGLWLLSFGDATGRQWTVYVPQRVGSAITLPDVRSGTQEVVRGTVNVRVSARAFDSFDFNRFRFSDLSHFRDRSDSAPFTIIVP